MGINPHSNEVVLCSRAPWLPAWLPPKVVGRGMNIVSGLNQRPKIDVNNPLRFDTYTILIHSLCVHYMYTMYVRGTYTWVCSPDNFYILCHS